MVKDKFISKNNNQYYLFILVLDYILDGLEEQIRDIIVVLLEDIKDSDEFLKKNQSYGF